MWFLLMLVILLTNAEGSETAQSLLWPHLQNLCVTS
jgi:hypothetical protein